MKERNNPYLLRCEYLNKCTLEDGKTVDVGHTGELVVIDKQTAVIGDDRTVFVAQGPDIFKVVYLEPFNHKLEKNVFTIEEVQEHLSDKYQPLKYTVSKTFTIDSAQELDWYNRLQKYVNENGIEYHELNYDPDMVQIREDASTASDENLGLLVGDVMGKALGMDIDDEDRALARVKMTVDKLKKNGYVDSCESKNANAIFFGYQCSDEKSALEMQAQRLERGFDDTETWNLNSTICRFIAPRLKRFIELTDGYPASFVDPDGMEKWRDILREMLWSFENYDIDDISWNSDTLEPDPEGTYFYDLPDETKEKITAKYKRGFKLFHDYFESLWW